MIFLVIALAPGVMLLASRVEQRLGAYAAGWVAALPVAFAMAATGIELSSGGRAAATMALSAAGHVPAQIAFAACSAAVLRRRGLVAALVTGTTGYALLSLLLAGLDPWERLLAAVVALVAGPRLISRPRASTMTADVGGQSPVLLSCALAALIVAAVTLTSSLVGPSAAGTVAAFPTMSGTLATFVGRRRGRQAAIEALDGLSRSLPCYYAFCLVTGLAASRVPLPACMVMALVASMVLALLTWRGVPTPRRPLGACELRACEPGLR